MKHFKIFFVKFYVLLAINTFAQIEPLSPLNIDTVVLSPLTLQYQYSLSNTNCSKPRITITFPTEYITLNAPMQSLLDDRFEIVSDVDGTIILEYVGSLEYNVAGQFDLPFSTLSSCTAVSASILVALTNCGSENNTITHQIDIRTPQFEPKISLAHKSGKICKGSRVFYTLTAIGAANSLINLQITSGLGVSIVGVYNSIGNPLMPPPISLQVLNLTKPRNGLDVFFIELELSCTASQNVDYSYRLSGGALCNVSYESINHSGTININRSCCQDFPAEFIKENEKSELRFMPLPDGCKVHYYKLKLRDTGGINPIKLSNITDFIPMGLIQSNYGSSHLTASYILKNALDYTISQGDLGSNFLNPSTECPPLPVLATPSNVPNPLPIAIDYTPSIHENIIPIGGSLEITIPYLIRCNVPYSTRLDTVSIINTAKAKYARGVTDYNATDIDTSFVNRDIPILSVNKKFRREFPDGDFFYRSNGLVDFNQDIEYLIDIENYGIERAQGIILKDKYSHSYFIHHPRSFQWSTNMSGPWDTISSNPVRSPYIEIAPLRDSFTIHNINIEDATCDSSKHFYIRYLVMIPRIDSPCKIDYSNKIKLYHLDTTILYNDSIQQDISNRNASSNMRNTNNPEIMYSLSHRCISDSLSNSFTPFTLDLIPGSDVEYQFTVINSSDKSFPNFRILGYPPAIKDHKILDPIANKFSSGSSSYPLQNLRDFQISLNGGSFIPFGQVTLGMTYGAGYVSRLVSPATEPSIHRAFIVAPSTSYSLPVLGNQITEIQYKDSGSFNPYDTIRIRYKATIPPSSVNSEFQTSFAFSSILNGCIDFKDEKSIMLLTSNKNCNSINHDICDNIQIGTIAKIRSSDHYGVELQPITSSLSLASLNAIDSMNIQIYAPYRDTAFIEEYNIKSITLNTTNLNTPVVNQGIKSFTLTKTIPTTIFGSSAAVNFNGYANGINFKYKIPMQIVFYLDKCTTCIKKYLLNISP